MSVRQDKYDKSKHPFCKDCFSNIPVNIASNRNKSLLFTSRGKVKGISFCISCKNNILQYLVIQTGGITNDHETKKFKLR